MEQVISIYHYVPLTDLLLGKDREEGSRCSKAEEGETQKIVCIYLLIKLNIRTFPKYLGDLSDKHCATLPYLHLSIDALFL